MVRLLRLIAPACLFSALFFPVRCSGSRAKADFGNLPLSFEANRGQFDPRVSYAARGEGFVVFLIGRGPRDWKTGIPDYGRIAGRDINPGRNPQDVQVEFAGAESLRLDGGN